MSPGPFTEETRKWGVEQCGRARYSKSLMLVGEASASAWEQAVNRGGTAEVNAFVLMGGGVFILRFI